MLLVHTKIEMIMRYAHYSSDQLQGALRFMNMVEDESESLVMLMGYKKWCPLVDDLQTSF